MIRTFTEQWAEDQEKVGVVHLLGLHAKGVPACCAPMLPVDTTTTIRIDRINCPSCLRIAREEL